MAPANCESKINVKNETDKEDKVPLRDIEFWLPYTKIHLRDRIPHVTTFDSLVELPMAGIGYLLWIVITIMRKKRVVSGERMRNITLKVQIDAWLR